LFLRYKLFFKLFFVWKNIKLIFKKNKLFWYANIKNLKNYFNIFLIKKIFLKTSCITISNKHCYHLYIVIYLFIYLAIWGFSLDLLAFYLPSKHCYHLYIVIYLFIYLAIWGFSLDLPMCTQFYRRVKTQVLDGQEQGC
jgi:hypothetical protein